jgi:tol-pal system protein YbgF
MKKLFLAAFLILPVACASTSDAPEPMPAPAPAPDPRVGELQTAMTEMLERLDVMNSRLNRLEENGGASAMAAQPVRAELRVEAAAPAPAPEPAVREEAVPEAATPSPEPVTRTAAAPQQPVPQQAALVGAKLAEDYRQAIMLFGRGRHAEARRAFETIFQADSQGDLADNALFWIGETYYAAGDFTNAVRYYQRVVNDFSDQNKAPDALFKIALSQERTGDLALARRTLNQVVERYPYSSTASSAKAELQRIKY